MKGTPASQLCARLYLRDDSRILLVGAPEGFESELTPLPGTVTYTRRLSRASHDVILVLVRNYADVGSQIESNIPRLIPSGNLWICWPAAHLSTDPALSEPSIRGAGSDAGLAGHELCELGRDWRAVRFNLKRRR
jgi:hypothetical protein